MTADVRARKALDRGLGFLLLGATFASPVGARATDGLNAILRAAGWRYGVTF